MIISLSGKKRSGKSSAAKFLVSKYKFVEVSWAHPLKEIIGRQLFGLDDDHLYGTTEEREAIIPEWNLSAREILQIVGTDMFREQICDDFWVKAGLKVIRNHLNEGRTDIVISDTRFPNEAFAALNLGGKTVQIRRTNEQGEEIKLDEEHFSERALDDWQFDYVVRAKSGDLPTVYDQMAYIIEKEKNNGKV